MTQPGNDHSLEGVTLCAGTASGEVLVLEQPLSLWGGTDLASGRITDVHHPQHGVSLVGRVVLMSASRGSSSSSSVLAEQIRSGVGPAAIVLLERDGILCLGALAATELYGIRMPIVLIPRGGALPAGRVTVSAEGDRARLEWNR